MELPRARLWFAQWLLMMLENGHEATLSILEIFGRLKIFIKCCWILRLAIIYHGLVHVLESVGRGRLVLVSQLETHWGQRGFYPVGKLRVF